MKFALVHFTRDPVGFRVVKVYTSKKKALTDREDIVADLVENANKNRQAQFDRGEACRSVVGEREYDMAYRIQEVD